jgi:hypothetical protein
VIAYTDDMEAEFLRVKTRILGFIKAFFERHPECRGLRTYDEVIPKFLKEFNEWTGSTTSAC